MAGSWACCGRAALVVLAGAAIASAVAARAASAPVCGPDGYAYAGVVSSSPAFGIRAVVTPVVAARVRSGHVAGWVGVGGPGEGPGGADEWLQVGLSAFPNQAGYNLYYEVMAAGGAARYHQLAANASVGEAMDVAVLELRGRANWWRVWVNGAPRSRPLFLPGSDRRWAPMATSESWDGGTAGACTNSFLFRFGHVRIAHAPGGGWQRLGSSATIGTPNLTVRRHGDSFLAAAGTAAERMLGSTAP
jgi:hypothetical protein